MEKLLSVFGELKDKFRLLQLNLQLKLQILLILKKLRSGHNYGKIMFLWQNQILIVAELLQLHQEHVPIQLLLLLKVVPQKQLDNLIWR
jgi:hypothetical protein